MENLSKNQNRFDLPYITLAQVIKQTGIDEDNLLLYAINNKITLCVYLRNCIADIEALSESALWPPYNQKNKHYHVITFTKINEKEAKRDNNLFDIFINTESNRASISGLFTLSNAFLEKILFKRKINEIKLFPYNCKELCVLKIEPNLFGEDIFSQLVMPRTELDKLMSGNEGQQSEDVGSENAKPELIEEQKKPKRKRKIKHIILYEDAVELVKSGRIELYNERQNFINDWAKKTDEEGNQLYHPRTINRYIGYAEEDLGKQ